MQFVVVGLVVAAALAWITGVMGERLAREQAVDDARTRTELIAETVIEPSLSSGLLDIEAGDLDRFDRVDSAVECSAATSSASRCGTPTGSSSTPMSRG